jgi:hypothetical protein
MTKENAGVCDRVRKLGGDALRLGRGTWLVGLGALAVAREETRAVIDRLRTRGEEVADNETGPLRRGYLGLTGRAKRFGTGMEDRARSAVDRALRRAGVPSQEELGDLIDRVEKLTSKLDRLAAGR